VRPRSVLVITGSREAPSRREGGRFTVSLFRVSRCAIRSRFSATFARKLMMHGDGNRDAFRIFGTSFANRWISSRGQIRSDRRSSRMENRLGRQERNEKILNRESLWNESNAASNEPIDRSLSPVQFAAKWCVNSVRTLAPRPLDQSCE
jgi:hypothetical protein